MPVDSKHPEYVKVCDRWDLVRSVVSNKASHWIRTVDSNDAARSKQYKQDAILTNFTRLTKTGLTGLVFRKDSKSELPKSLEYLQDDATGSNLSLEQLCQKIVGEVLITGRYGLLAEFPQIDNSSEASARIRPYTAESIINWKYIHVKDKYMLSLVVLKEEIDDVGEDGFEWVEKCQYRVLFLNSEMYYSQAIYNEDLELVPNSIVVPVDYNGEPFDQIPFTFIGSENNDGYLDELPLYDLAVLNLGHYRNSADYEESIFISGQPFLVVSVGETGVEEYHNANPDGLKFGSRAGLVLGNGGNASLLQASPNQLADAAMKRKEEQAAAIGARLIAPPGGRETAEGARIRYGSQNSSLYTITKNISRAIEESLWYIARFMMEDPEYSKYDLNDQFYEENADPNLIAQEIMLLDRGLMTIPEIRDNLKRTGLKLDDNFVEPVIDPLQGVDGGDPDVIE